jgi:DNA-binding transcriptional LysR family regulator
MSMNLDHLRTFARVAQCQSFSLAAEQTGVAQSVVSKHVAALERRLGMRLLSRTTRQVRLTPEGVTYLGFVQRILGDLEEAESAVRRAKASPSGLVRIGSPYSFAQHFLTGIVAKLLARHPAIQAQIIVSDASPNLVEQDIDVAIRFGELSGDVVSKRIGQMERVLVAAPAYLERAGTPGMPADLAGHECILYDNPTLSRTWVFRDEADPVSVNPTGRFGANSAQIVRDACLAGLGIALMPEWLFAEDVAAGRLIRVLEGHRAEPLPLSLVYASRKYVSLKTRTIVDFLAQELASNLLQRAQILN